MVHTFDHSSSITVLFMQVEGVVYWVGMDWHENKLGKRTAGETEDSGR